MTSHRRPHRPRQTTSAFPPRCAPGAAIVDGDGTGHAAAGHTKRGIHRWSRWIHVYTSMVALLIVLFFGVTGITLNHPKWTFGDDVDTTTTDWRAALRRQGGRRVGRLPGGLGVRPQRATA